MGNIRSVTHRELSFLGAIVKVGESDFLLFTRYEGSRALGDIISEKGHFFLTM